jgi:subtilisin family serine protease
MTPRQTIGAPPGGRGVWASEREQEDTAWTLLLDGHFENLPGEWSVARDAGGTRVLPVINKNRPHRGSRSVFMTGAGLAESEPPEPYIEGARSYLISPPFSLSGYKDAFVELWFWARFEDPQDEPRRIHDFARVFLYDMVSDSFVHDVPIAPVGPEGDLTRERGTDNGWRKVLFRVPQEVRLPALQIFVQFVSDGAVGGEGIFIDDMRVLATIGSRRTASGRDPASAVQYALEPRGQIAGWPEEGNPVSHGSAGWQGGFAAEDVIVALLDDGVDRGHPDLAFWEPELEVEGEPGDERAELDEEQDAQKEETAGEDEPDAGPEEEGDPGRSGRSEPEGSGARAAAGATTDREPYRLAPGEELFPGAPATGEDRHGTACAGVLGAIADNGIGIAGTAPGAKLLPLNRGIDDVSIVRAIDAAVLYGARVLVIPWGWSGAYSRTITQAITEAIDAGMLVVAAAGDGVHRPYSDGVDYPCVLGASTPLLCVGASSIAGEPKGVASADGQYWWKSAAGPSGPNLLAPGTWLHATDLRGALGYNDGSGEVPPDYTETFSGTGAAACYAAGVATLMVSRDPRISTEQAKEILTKTATPLGGGAAGRNAQRLVAPDRAVQAAIELAIERERGRTRATTENE